jgi:hypothetical protein
MIDDEVMKDKGRTRYIDRVEYACDQSAGLEMSLLLLGSWKLSFEISSLHLEEHCRIYEMGDRSHGLRGIKPMA